MSFAAGPAGGGGVIASQDLSDALGRSASHRTLRP